MKFIECLQGTPEWHLARCGLVTASRFGDAVQMVGGLDERQALFVRLMGEFGNPKTAALKAGYSAVPRSSIITRALAGEDVAAHSDVALRYAADLAIERVSGKPHGEPPKAWVLERGHQMEAAARRIYEGRTKAFVTEAGICVDGHGHGYSTDGLVEKDGLIEVKAPIDSAKILAMWETGDTAEYDHQCQGGLWLTGRKWVDFLMYVPDLEGVGKDLYVKRIHRNDAFIDAMVLGLARFQSIVSQYEAILRKAVA